MSQPLATMSNVRSALGMLASISCGELAEPLLHSDFRAWTLSSGDLSGLDYRDAVRRFAGIFVEPLELTVLGVTDGGERVAVEAESRGRMRNGELYENRYHFLLVFTDGLVAEIREYLDPRQFDVHARRLMAQAT